MEVSAMSARPQSHSHSLIDPLYYLMLGLRPFGVSLLYAGYDAHHSFQLYHSDPSGNYSGWKATCIGSNNGTATSLLKQDYKDELTIQEAMSLACKVLSKTMDATSLDSEKSEQRVSFLSLSYPHTFFPSLVEFATLSLDSTGLPQSRIFRPADITRLLEREGFSKKSEEESPSTTAAGGDVMAVDS